MTDPHKPNTAFVDALGGELESAARRREAFRSIVSTPPARTPGRSRIALVISATAIASIVLGSAAAFAVVKQRDARWADENIARAERRLEFAEERQARFQFSFAKPVYDFRFAFNFGEPDAEGTAAKEDAGGVETDADKAFDAEKLAAQLEEESVATSVELRALDVEEVSLSGRPPNNSLSAPLVYDRDFVTERLELDRAIASAQLSLLTEVWQYDLAHTPDGPVAVGRIATMASQVTQIDENLSTRQLFLDGEISAIDAEWKLLYHNAKHRKNAAVQAIARATAGYTSVKGNEAEKIAHTVLLDVLAAQLELNLATQELKTIEQKLGVESESP